MAMPRSSVIAMSLRRPLVRQMSTFLDRRPANYAPLTPLTFLERTASIFPSHTAIVYDDWKGRVGSTAPPSLVQTWAETNTRVTKLASALSKLGIGRGDTVAILSPNTPAFVETHHGVNAVGGVVNPLNTRLDAATLAYILDHSDCKVLLADTAFAATTKQALDELSSSRGPGSLPLPTVVDLVDPIESHAAATNGASVGDLDYEQLLATGSDDYSWVLPEDEWESQALNYTSGTTGRPKGVLYHHRGAALNAINNALIMGLEQHPKYLWTLPMFRAPRRTRPFELGVAAEHARALPVPRLSADSRPAVAQTAMAGASHTRSRCKLARTCACARRTRRRSSVRSARRVSRTCVARPW